MLTTLQRGLMRRAYNAGRYEAARSRAHRLLSIPKEQALARSVIVRSLWNEKSFETPIQAGQDWHDAASQEHVALAKERLEGRMKDGPAHSAKRKEQMAQLLSEQPLPTSSMDWHPDNMVANFSQEGRRVWFRFPHGHVFWDMPEGYSLADTHPTLLCLTAEVLVYPWEPSTKKPFPNIRSRGQRPGLAFSAGTDSSAAALVMPEETLLAYHRRSFDSMIDHRNAEQLINHLNASGERDVIQIESNHELIRSHHGKQMGFSFDFACGAHLILLADHFDLGALGFGMLLDNAYLWKGAKFRNFEQTPYCTYWTSRFADAGLDLLLPLVGVSEAGALKIVEQSSWLAHLNSCMRGDGTQGCGQCWKCFHKNGPLGRPFDITAPEIQYFLNKRPMPTATHALWALQTMGLEHETPDLAHLFEMNFEWWTCAYPPGFELLPERWRTGIETKIRAMLPVMSPPYELQDVNHFP